ncbi:hypothetical protein Cni_G14567 [Canna indica]|uniref:C2H2-type domain-containing protein n=1 Tax=Canna indica TaxID=4628 RepID=A0AAQ3QDT2_9LILI|nr:hypothetical protein Cni_G14567 [Canna indica]
MDSVQPLESIKTPQTAIMSTSEQIQALKVPEAVVALAQAAAKVNDLPGWSLLAPCKVQFQKCEKCSREFCSTINFRRHIRVHRRSLNIDKDFSKNRVLLEAYWDKLRLEEAKDIILLRNVVVEDVTGPSIIKALSIFIQSLGLPLLPHAYIKAGATLLDVIEGNTSRFPLSSQELFSVLDDASEKTFLHTGSALSMQKYIFNGDAGTIALDTKNLVAFASFMLEQKLVKSWHAHKDVEALRCQHLLMEEEEAAKKRQAEIQERKKMKKLRQKEKRANILTDITKSNNEAYSYNTVERMCCSTETSSLLPASESCLDIARPSVSQEIPCGEFTILVEPHLHENINIEDTDHIVNQEMVTKASGCQLIPISGEVLMLTENVSSGSQLGEVPSAKSSQTPTNDFTIWTQKIKPEKVDANEGNTNPRVKYGYNKCEVLIGSISVTLRKGFDHCREASPLVQNLNTSDRMELELQKPVCLDLGDSSIEETNINQFLAQSVNHIPAEGTCFASGAMDDNPDNSNLGTPDFSLSRLFSNHIAKTFLEEKDQQTQQTDIWTRLPQLDVFAAEAKFSAGQYRIHWIKRIHKKKSNWFR